MKRSPVTAGVVTVLGLLMLGGSVAAQKLEIKSDVDREADFSTIRTYAILPPAPMLTDMAPDAPITFPVADSSCWIRSSHAQ